MTDTPKGGRPSRTQISDERQNLARLVAVGFPEAEAAAQLRIPDGRALKLISEAQFKALVVELRSGRAQSVAVIVGHDQALEAA